jgi:hypothetical protein
MSSRPMLSGTVESPEVSALHHKVARLEQECSNLRRALAEEQGKRAAFEASRRDLRHQMEPWRPQGIPLSR